MRFNPFRPNGIVPANMFCGREDEMRLVRQSLFQTANENPQHFLFEGEKGIGKSSLLHFIQEEAAGRYHAEGETGLKFLVISIELVESQNYGSILHSIATEFRTQLFVRKDASVLAKKGWEFLTSWKACGIEYKRGDVNNVETDLLDELARQMAKFTDKAATRLDALGQIDGILILIDEADKPSETARLGEFCKLFTERLTKIGCGRVCIGLSGLPTLLGKLRGSHDSSPRIFENATVGLLPASARLQVIMRAIEDANKINPEKTIIQDDATELIAALSEGYPHFVQQFGASAFLSDKDNNITEADVLDGAFEVNGAIDQLGKRYFRDMYYQQIWSPDYRKVLHAMTESYDAWVSRAEILSKSDISASKLNNALHALKEKGIILPNLEKKAEYRLPSKSFAVWLKIQELKAKKSVDDTN